MEVIILSRYDIERALGRIDPEPGSILVNDYNVEEILKEDIIISITDSPTGFSDYDKPLFLKKHDIILKLVFDDVSEDEAASPTNRGKTKAFDVVQANQVLDFLEKHKDKKRCIVHCAAGISRSGAIGSFVNDVYGSGNFLELKRRNPYIMPSPYVSQVIRREYARRVEGKD